MKDDNSIKAPQHKLNFDKIMSKAKAKTKKKTRYTREDYLNELEEEQGVKINVRSIQNLSASLPYAVSVLSAMAKKANTSIEKIIEKK